MLNGNTIEEIPEVVRDGYHIAYFLLDNERFDFNTKVESDLILVAVWKKLTEKDLATKFLKDINYMNLLNDGIDLNLNIKLDSYLTPVEESMPVGTKINDINIDLIFKFDLKSLSLLFDLNIEFKTAEFGAHTPDGFEIWDANYSKDGGYLNQKFILSGNKVYSSFDSLVNLGSANNSLFESIESLGMVIPAEYKPVVQEYKDIVENHQEYTELIINLQTLKDIINFIKPYVNNLNNMIEELVKYSPAKFRVNENTLTIKNDFLLPFNIEIEKTDDNNIKRLDLVSNGINSVITSSLKTDPEINLEDLDNYKHVTNLRIEKIFKDFI